MNSVATDIAESEVSDTQSDSSLIKRGGKRWIFLLVIFLTVLVPNIIAWQFNKEFAFDYPIGEEFQIAKSIGAIIALIMIWNYISLFKINKYLKFVLVFLSLIPLFRLYLVSYLFLISKDATDLNGSDPISPKKVTLDILVLFIGFWSIYLISQSVIPLLAQIEVMTNLLRLLLAFIVLYFVSLRHFRLNNVIMTLFLLLGITFYFFPVI